MKLSALINEEKHEIDFRREDGRVFAAVDGREHLLEVSEPEENVYLFKHNGKVIEVFVDPVQGHCFNVRIDTHEMNVSLLDPKRLRGSGSGATAADGIIEIRSAMPGKVVRVLAEAGTEVEPGDGIIVVEAMKMQNELKSPKAGIVKELRVADGSTVNAGDVLAVIE